MISLFLNFSSLCFWLPDIRIKEMELHGRKYSLFSVADKWDKVHKENLFDENEHRLIVLTWLLTVN